MPASMTPGVAAPMHDDLVFLDETPRAPTRPSRPGWRILIVDDDADVHSTTTFALAGLEVQDRPLEFLHARSAHAARAVLAQEPDIAVILLDVVMEQPDAGLQLVRHIRETLAMKDVRIILRTGQPGYTPEMEAIRDLDINDYRTKSELTRTKLYTTVAAAVRCYQQLRALVIGRAGLERIVHAGTELMRLHGARDVARSVLRQAAALLGQEAAGVLCVREAGGLRVLGAAGSALELEGLTLDAHEEAMLLGAAARALAECQSEFSPTCMALYFPGKSGRDFCAAIPLSQPVSEGNGRLLHVFASVVAVGLDNVELVGRLNTAAFFDRLTGLPNRTRLVEELDAAVAQGKAPGGTLEATLTLVDLDHFAETNDALGHQFGDALLVTVAQRLQQQLDARLTVARISGDIFAVLGMAERNTPAAIQALFAAPFSIDGQDVQVSATLGLVRLHEHDGSGADALKDADIALKRAKSQQRSGHFYFSRSMGVEIRERVRLMHALRRGVGRGELFLAYQPQVDLATHRPFGAEALLRWRLEDGTMIPPDRFIPIAEYSGLIVEIGAWVLREACAELMRLRSAGHLAFTMSVNVSQAQFRHPHFVDVLRRALRESGAPPEYIELEITESMAMEEPQQLTEMLAQVKRTGVSIAIDDFGTGFSSLSHLQRLKVDRLKIDRAFVSEITGSARGSSIAEMVIQLGRNLGLSVIAEGVEDERQAQILHALGCPLAQGYLFSRPLSPQALLEWLGTQQLENAA
ncbi:putative bifunctional diguanylate cyclase/phosphodiesterase [Massilia sp. CMS3.1]|uniref:putative bifunctional diguanylate cyclase/phosphodiesterase n=1 Tax=Massilia sp. CMS3.1 TaxID=3373083 RepID=UPI003EE69CC8